MAPKKDYTPHQMGQAIEAVRNGEKVATAARRFNVPRVTLLNKVTGKTQINCTMGPTSVLTKEEESILVRWLLALAARRFPISKQYLLESVQKIMVDQKRENPFTDNKPGRTWFESFLKRNPEIREKTAQNITKARDDVTEEDIIKWFEEVDSYLEENGLKDILKDPSRIFNADESAFFLTPKQGKVLAKRGDNNLYSAGGDEKENLSVLITANAAGVMAPPMVIYNYERVPAYISAGVPEKWAIGRSESGWMCSSTFFEYVCNIFNPWLTEQGIKRPILFFLDGHRSHLTLHLANFCAANEIELIALYPNSTHILQPMDLSVFRPLKQAWKKAVSDFKNETGESLKKQHFAPVLEKAISTLTPECIKNGFRSGGLYPHGYEYIDMSKIRNRREKNTDLCQQQINTKQTLFLQYLENEIIKIFTQQKLNLFNSLYYENRTELEEKLPSEDMALYIVWANNKQMFLANNRLCRPDNLPGEAECTDTTNSSSRDPQTQRTSTSIVNKPCNTVEKSVTSDKIDSNPAEISASIKALMNKSPTEQTIVNDTTLIRNLHNHSDSVNGQVTLSTLNISNTLVDNDNNESILSTLENNSQNQIPLAREGDPRTVNDTPLSQIFLNNNDSVKGQTTPIKLKLSNIVDGNQNNENEPMITSEDNSQNQIPSAKESEETKRNSSSSILQSYQNLLISECITASGPNCNISNTVTPVKKSIENVLGINVPTPFKKNLFWPENDGKKKHRLKREKIPSAVTSLAWREYHDKKEKEKKRLQEEKEERARQRQEKKIMKQKLTEEKKKLSLKRKRKNQVQEKSSSEETDLSDVHYAESGDSYVELDSDGDEYVDTVIKQSSDKRKIQKRKLTKSFSSDSEAPLCNLRSSTKDKKKNIGLGCFVIVNYEGEYFPGKVENIRGKCYEVSTMVLSAGNSFRWPEKPDKIWYNNEKIVEKIIEPICLNKRGYYRIPEMEKYLPDIYLSF